MPSQVTLSIILPCYNERDNVSTLIETYSKLTQGPVDLEVIFVDNGSSDGTAEMINTTLGRLGNPRLKTTRVEVNQGYGHGILQGLNQASGRFLAWSHADQQCPPEDVLKVYSAIQKSPSPETCFGKGFRVNARGRSQWLTSFQEFLTFLILGTRMKEINAQPKVFPRSLFESFKQPPKGYELDIYAYYKALYGNYSIIPVDVLFLDRKHGQSKWSFSLNSKIRLMLSNFRYLLFLRFNKNSI